MKVKPFLGLEEWLREFDLFCLNKAESEPNPMITIQAIRVNLKDGTMDFAEGFW